MSIFVNKETKLLVQGITGREGQFHTRQCVEYGTQVVGGVTPGRGGQLVRLVDIPLLETVGHPFAVEPTRPLEKMAGQKGWPVLRYRL